jgi:hypothetical protein
LGDGFIDPRLYQLDEELKKVDELVSQGPLLKPFEEVFDESRGRPGTPAGIYLRMMDLKLRWGLSYEEVEIEVRERLSWRYFCHWSLMDTVPDATPLIQLNQRFGEERVANLNKQLVGHWVKHRAIKPRRIRIDSTTLEAHIASIPPTSEYSTQRCERLAVQRDRWGKRLSALYEPLRKPWPVGEPVLRPSPKNVKPKVKRFSRK